MPCDWPESFSNFFTSFSVINSGLIRVELDVSAPGDLKKTHEMEIELIDVVMSRYLSP